ncbi:MAG: molybdopterin molybdotransferase MoeA [Nitrososphaerota archaeon]|nr:molybdopterin molybdotransferase MoeA [Aigarchaeota archaeon]MDW8076928.1 molybdopterin molybdotransferase MoeA [Nitrososphaerota archaeon]
MRKRMKGFPALVSFKESKQKLAEIIKYRIIETVDVTLEDALNMVCAEDVLAPTDCPEFDRSAVDGYAVIAEDTFGSSPSNPVELKLVGRAHAGMKPSDIPKIDRGETVEIYTGAPLPEGANAVVMVEHTNKLDNSIEVLYPVSPYQNVSKRGEDYKKGDIVIKKGTRIRPWHIAALAELNISRVKVLRKPRIAVLSTGSELVEVGSELNVGNVVNSSKPMLKSLLKETGCEVLDLGTVPDDLEMIKESIRKGLRMADAIIITGGTSVGELDLVPEAINSLGKPGLVVHGIMMRPAKTTGFGVIDNKPIFMLSGLPVAALVGFQNFIKPSIQMMLGLPDELKLMLRGKLTRRIANPHGVRSFIRVRVVRKDDNYYVEPLVLTGSGLVSTLTKANGILVIPENVEGYDEGEEVEVELLQPIETSIGDCNGLDIS